MNSIMKLKTKNAGDARHGFTLIELMVVVSLIAILLGFIVPAYFGVRENARRAKAMAAAKNLETAFKEYLNHYRVWPSVVANENEYQVKDDLFLILRGDTHADNPDKIAFFEFEAVPSGAAANAAYDPWKDDFEPYRVKFDANFDNKIGDVFRSVMVWSVGPDRTNNTDDDVTSWQ